MTPLSPSPTVAQRPSSGFSQAGFSLVEIVLAIGVVAFAFVALLGMLPTGMGVFRQAIDVSVGSSIAQKIINDAQQTDFDVLTNYANFESRGQSSDDSSFVSGLRYFDEQGSEVLLSGEGELSEEDRLRVLYHVLVRVIPATRLPGSDSTGSDRGAAEDIATVTVQIANNPAHRKLEVQTAGEGEDGSANTNLWPENVPGVPITTYSAIIARNGYKPKKQTAP